MCNVFECKFMLMSYDFVAGKFSVCVCVSYMYRLLNKKQRYQISLLLSYHNAAIKIFLIDNVITW